MTLARDDLFFILYVLEGAKDIMREFAIKQTISLFLLSQVTIGSDVSLLLLSNRNKRKGRKEIEQQGWGEETWSEEWEGRIGGKDGRRGEREDGRSKSKKERSEKKQDINFHEALGLVIAWDLPNSKTLVKIL